MPTQKLFSNAHAPLMLRHFFASQIGTRVSKLGRFAAKVSKCLILKNLRPMPYCQIGVPKWRPPHRRHEEMGARRRALISAFWKHPAHGCLSMGMPHFGTWDSNFKIPNSWKFATFQKPLRNLFLSKQFVTLLDLCVSSLRRGHANLLCIVPILTDDLRRGSNGKILK